MSLIKFRQTRSLPLQFRAGRSRQGGFAVLLTSLMLLFLITLVTLYAANMAVVEQQVSANQYRAEQALSTADAGMDWGLWYFEQGLDQDKDNTIDCTSAARCPNTSDSIAANNTIFAGADNATATVSVFFCRKGQAYSINSVDDTCAAPSPNAQEIGIVSIGYSDDDAAIRIVKQEIKTMTFMGEGPKSPVSSISMVDLTGALRVVNRYYTTTIWSGNAVVAWGAAESYIRNPDYYLEKGDLNGDGVADDRTKLIDNDFGNDWSVLASGKDWQETNLDVIDGDINLKNLADDPDALFEMFFNGKSKSAFEEAAAADPDQSYTKAEFDALTSTQKNNLTGYIWISGVDVDVSDVGSVDGSALVVVEGSVRVNGGEFYGLLYVADPNPGTTGDGDGQWRGAGNHSSYGALVSEGDISASGTVDIIYYPDAFSSDNMPVSGARVSGTWKDW